MGEVLATVGFVAATLQLLNCTRGIADEISNARSWIRSFPEWNQHVALLSSLVKNLEDSCWPNDPSLSPIVSCYKDQVARLRRLVDKLQRDDGHEKMKRWKRAVIAVTKAKELTRKLRSAEQDILALRQSLILEQMHDFGTRFAVQHESIFLLGAYDAETLHRLNNVAITLYNQGKFVESKDLHLQVLLVKERLFGVSDPETLTTVNNYGLCLQALGHHSAAHAQFVHALEGRRLCFEVDDPAVLSSMCNLATSFQFQNKLQEAEELQSRCLKGRARVLGEEDPETLKSQSNLAIVLYYRQKEAEAEKLFRKTADALHSKLGFDHLETIRVNLNLAKLLRDQLRYEEAERIALKAQNAAQQRYGESHWQTLAAMHTISVLLHRQKRLQESLQIAVRIKEIRNECLGFADPRTQYSICHIQQLEAALQESTQPVYEGHSSLIGSEKTVVVQKQSD